MSEYISGGFNHRVRSIISDGQSGATLIVRHSNVCCGTNYNKNN